MAKASPERAGDALAGVIAATDAERVAAQSALADLPIRIFLTEAVVPYEDDAVTRLIIDDHDADAFAPVTHLTVGDFLNWLLSEQADTAALRFRPSGVQAVVSGTPAGE
jgi:ethanolamine ammonia-lyase large subunit